MVLLGVISCQGWGTLLLLGPKPGSNSAGEVRREYSELCSKGYDVTETLQYGGRHWLSLPAGVNLVSIKPHYPSTMIPIISPLYLSFSPALALYHSPTYLSICTANTHSFHLPSPDPTMVTTTRTKNKHAHPAAPVMTKADKEKAGIKVKRRAKRVTKDDTIRELQAKLAALENPGEEPFSKEPLVRPLHVLSTNQINY